MRFQLFIIFISLYVTFSYPMTSISGHIDTIVFSSNANPYFVEKDLIVPKDKIVTIPQGCVFLFNPFSGIEVHGTLIAGGAQDTPVVFTSVNDSVYNKNSMRTAAPFDWNGILIGKESCGSQLNHFILSYSVYGVKAQSADLSINGGLFRSNGQFHFTVDGKILDVKENLQFSFGNYSEGAQTRPAPMAISVTIPHDNRTFTARELIKSKPFYYSSLGVGVLGAGLGVFFAVKANQHQSALQQISSGAAPPDKNRWNSERDAKWNCITGSSISFILGALGSAGFGLSLAF